MRKIKVLIISPSEICYNPRLIKAAQCFFNNGYEVTVWNAVTGLASLDLSKKFNSEQQWQIIDFDISKRNFLSKFNWLKVAILQFFAKKYFAVFNKTNFGFYYVRNKAYAGFNINFIPDIIYINVVDTLPLAVKIAKKNKTKLIYDSQEFFIGQFKTASKQILNWVQIAEKKHINDCYLILTTTNVMKDKIASLYKPKAPIYRVRNLPFAYQLPKKAQNKTLQLIWHGFAIYYNSRGINILLHAIVNCKTDVKLNLQGKISVTEKNTIEAFLIKNNALNKVNFIDPASPDKIVESLIGYDIGLIGELPLDENQLLTSSNKLFDYLHAGLAVISSDMPGLTETINESLAGHIYIAGNYTQLSTEIDNLNSNRNQLECLKQNAIAFSKNNFWQKDFEPVISYLKI